jgi:hypothetical protein
MFRPLAKDNPNMTVTVLGGDASQYNQQKYYGTNSQRINFFSGDSPVMSAPSSFPRYDLISISPSGDVIVKTGTESSSPAIPSCDSGDHYPVCAVYHRLGTTKIVNFSERGAFTGDSYIAHDLRPLYRKPISPSAISALATDERRNTKNIMLNRLKLMQTYTLTMNRMVDGWTDDFQDGSGIISKDHYSGDIAPGDGLRYSRNYTLRTSGDNDIVRGGNSLDGKVCVVLGPVGLDFQATRADVVAITESGDSFTCEISRNSGDSWNTVTMANDFYDGRFYYSSGVNTGVSGSYSSGTGDYMVTFTLASGTSLDFEGYGVSLA